MHIREMINLYRILDWLSNIQGKIVNLPVILQNPKNGARKDLEVRVPNPMEENY